MPFVKAPARQTVTGRVAGLRAGARRRARQGAILSAEMVMVFPVLTAILFGVVELSLLISSYNTMKLASSEAARVCSRTEADRETAATQAVADVLLQADAKVFGDSAATLIQVTVIEDGMSGDVTTTQSVSVPGLSADLEITIDMRSDMCCVTLEFPMSEGAPDLLAPLGLTTTGKSLKVTTCMLDEI